MVTDARGHEVPAGADMWGYREDMEDLSGSIADVRPVADQDAADDGVAELVADDIDPAGTVWWLANPGQLAVYDGDEWVPLASQAGLDDTVTAAVAKLPYAAASGTGSVASVGSESVKSTTITLPAGRFSRAPRVVATAQTSDPTRRMATALSGGGGSTSFVLYLYNGTLSTAEVGASWVAVQDSATVAQVLADDPGPDVAVTCPTDGCGNQDIPIPLHSTWTDDDGVTQPIGTVECGVCGTDLTDTLTPIAGS